MHYLDYSLSNTKNTLYFKIIYFHIQSIKTTCFELSFDHLQGFTSFKPIQNLAE